MKNDLLFEIGTEELPAGFVPKALKTLEGFLKKNLDAERLTYDNIKSYGTPRRLALIVEGLIDKQTDVRLEVKGPQKKAALDANGSPTKALEGFLKSQAVEFKDIVFVKTDKGEYASFTKDVAGRKTIDILPEILKDTLSQELYHKAMRWSDHDVSFTRPVHWLVAKYANDTIPFEWGHIQSSSTTLGHRFSGEPKKPVEIANASAYLDALKKAFVIADPAERKKTITEGVTQCAKDSGGRLIEDNDLIDEVTFLVENPVILRGSFDLEFLNLPRPVVINAMREHQRYFSIEDNAGKLLPYFITVANTAAKDMDVVRKGNERVLRARLNDAKFHFEKDVKKKLCDYVDNLKGVVFQAKLGTSYEKVERFTALSAHIASLNSAFKPLAKTIERASHLAKADLTTGMVGEFPKLQGTMGRIYGERSGETPEVSRAIEEHYMPIVSGGALPTTIPGAIVSIADKLDTITGCFGVGLIPTGSQDQYALRRQALGIISIIIEKGFILDLSALIDKSIELVGKKLKRKTDEVKRDVLEFFKERLRNMLLNKVSFDSIDAAISAQSATFDIVDINKKAVAIEDFKKHPDCAALVTAFKRVSNILKGINNLNSMPDETKFEDENERSLYRKCQEINPIIQKHFLNGDYESVLTTLASIKSVIDAFFDKVMVMSDNETLKNNRLALLSYVRGLYVSIADLSRLVA